MLLTFEQALAVVEKQVSAYPHPPAREVIPIDQSMGRILAEDLAADRDYPPFPRSARDGYAVRSVDVAPIPVTLTLIGESRAGEFFPGSVGPGECVSIMTGAPVPDGADAVVMVEHTHCDEDRVTLQRGVGAAENLVPRASEAAAGARVLARGKVLDAGDLGLLASIGAAHVPVFGRPEAAIVATGDELVAINATPKWHQIRNSNTSLLAAQVLMAGGAPRSFPPASDQADQLKQTISDALSSDILLLSGGVSAGKYDLVEQVLENLGAEFYFDAVAIRPGKPLVFGRVQNKFFFGLPGNPVSTYVTFQLFARPALRALGGGSFERPLFLGARLARPVQRREGLTAFIPAYAAREQGGPVVNPVPWQGSGDVAGLPAANCFLVIHPDCDAPQAGDWVDVMPKI